MYVHVLHTGIDYGLILQCKAGSPYEGRHESKLDAMPLDEGVLELFPHLNEGCHVHLVERGQHGVGVLSLLQPLCYPLPHPTHLCLRRGGRRGGGESVIVGRPAAVMCRLSPSAYPSFCSCPSRRLGSGWR